MEKQRIKRLFKSCRRFLITLLLASTTAFAFSQNLTLEQIKQLHFVPEEGQNLYTKTDLKFIVTIPNVRASQEESSPQNLEKAVFEHIKENDQKQWKNSEPENTSNLAEDF